MSDVDARGIAVEVRRYPLVVASVTDGDTIRGAVRLRRSSMAAASLGFHVRADGAWLLLEDAFRFDGIDAPERRTDPARWLAAKGYVEQLLPPGLRVTVATRQVRAKDAQEKYGRWLATVILPDGRSVTDLLLAVSLAVPWDGVGPHPVPAPS